MKSLVFGREEDTNGDMFRSCAGSASKLKGGRLGLSLSILRGSGRKAKCDVLLLTICSSGPLGPLEKKVAFEAVIGVLGVFMLTLVAGGVEGGSAVSILESLNAFILAAVGVLKGRRFKGGSLAAGPFFAGFG